MIDLERPVTQGESARLAIVGTKTKLAELAGDDQKLDDTQASLNEQGLNDLASHLHENSFLPTDIELEAVRVDFLDFRFGLNDDFVSLTLWLDLKLAELRARREANLPSNPSLRVELGAHNFTFPLFRMLGAFAHDIKDSEYEPDLQAQVQARLKEVAERFTRYKKVNEEPIIGVFNFVQNLLTPEKAAAREAPYGRQAPTLPDPDCFPFGLP